jgi:hypothetical protein
MNNKAQMSAPFELMVAIIIMGFVVVVGYSLMTELQKNMCQNDVDKAVTVFKNNLELAINNSTVQSFKFDYEGCFRESEAIAYISKHSDPRICERLCGEYRNTCFSLTFNATFSKGGGPYVSKCLKIPDLTNFEPGNSVDCSELQSADPSLDGFSIPSIQGSNIKENLILKGNYVLRTVSSSSIVPKVCVFYKR